MASVKDFKPGDLVRIPYGRVWEMDARVVKTTSDAVWVEGCDEFPESAGIYTFYPPQYVTHSDALQGPVLLYPLPKIS